MVDNVRLPVDVEEGAVGGPRFFTTIQQSLSGHEQRIGEWDTCRGEWDISYGIRSKTELADVRKLYLARMGRLYAFRFKDHSDYEATDEAIGTGDGTTATFQLKKTYTDTVNSYVRTIQLPVSGTLVVKVAGVTKTETTHYTVNYSTGVITFTGGNIPSAAQAVTATFEFDVPVRFDDDILKIRTGVNEVFNIPPITVVEVLGE